MAFGRGLGLSIRRAATVLAGLLLLPAAAVAAPPEPLNVGMVPDAGATQISVAEKAPLQAYLEHALGRPVHLLVPTSYNATVEALGGGSLDIAYLGGLTFVKARATYGVRPLVQRDIDQRFHSLFITRPSSGIARLADLKGRSFCFGDINSTSGHLYPYKVMKAAGVGPGQGLGSFRYTGSHPATIQAVAAGACAAGAVDETVFKSLVAEGKVAPGQLKVFLTAGPFADYVWVARRGVDPRAAQAFSDALLRLSAPQDRQVLSILRGDRYVRASDAEYADVEAVAKALGLM